MTVREITVSPINLFNEVTQSKGIFVQSMLKSKRIGELFLEKTNVLKVEEQETFQGILDGHPPKTSNSLPIKEQSLETKNININSSSLPLRDNHSNIEPKALIQDFVKLIWPKAKQAALLIDIDPKLLMAQIALETGWGKFVAKDEYGLSSNNLFNIKSKKGDPLDSVNLKTTEYLANTPIKVNASFRKYLSLEDSFYDYVSLIKENPRYQSTLANASNPELYVKELRKSGYATDPEYDIKILAIYRSEELNQAIQHFELA